jgi:hypothetical protein
MCVSALYKVESLSGDKGCAHCCVCVYVCVDALAVYKFEHLRSMTRLRLYVCVCSCVCALNSHNTCVSSCVPVEMCVRSVRACVRTCLHAYTYIVHAFARVYKCGCVRAP